MFLPICENDYANGVITLDQSGVQSRVLPESATLSTESASCLVPRMCAAHPCRAVSGGTLVAPVYNAGGIYRLWESGTDEPRGAEHIRGTRPRRNTFMLRCD